MTDDVKSFNKIVPALLVYPYAFIVTADDDMHYPQGWLRRFAEEYRNPREILCQRARRIARKENGDFAGYDDWKLIDSEDSGATVFPTGVHGILYPPGSLAPQVTDAEQFSRLSPTADDVWLYWMGALAGSTHRLIKPALSEPTTRSPQSVCLSTVNVLGGGNDRQIAAMVAEYGMPHGRQA